eukprot:gene30840-35879_t
MLPSEDAIELNSVEVDNADKVYESTDNVGMRIETGLYLGPSAAEQCFEMLRDVGITHILQGEYLCTAEKEYLVLLLSALDTS